MSTFRITEHPKPDPPEIKPRKLELKLNEIRWAESLEDLMELLRSHDLHCIVGTPHR